MSLSRLSLDHEPRLPLSVVTGKSARVSDAIRAMMIEKMSFSWEK